LRKFEYIKGQVKYWIPVVLIISACSDLFASQSGEKSDTIENKQNTSGPISKPNFIVKLDCIYGFLDTELTFYFPNGILSTNLGLEDNFGMPKQKLFFSGSFMYSSAKRSGAYIKYYRLARSHTFIPDPGYTYEGDTIPAGANTTIYLNTNVLSAGYLLSILRLPKVNLGAYFNVYLMKINMGINSDRDYFNSQTKMLAPLPNFGLISQFMIRDWFNIDAGIGFFSLKVDEYKGSIFTLEIALIFKPLQWLGISLSYQEFDVVIDYFPKDIDANLEYNYRGPSLGLSLVF
jgi:hypothetical protein